ncbi:MAG: ubiquinol-cytochrome c reductase iron-sulfur subunit [Planctomycetota bacterium]|nr:ubiquinol-cytochrome c reductase iron-sulfur subunit [Planctomycetota bacterium]
MADANESPSAPNPEETPKSDPAASPEAAAPASSEKAAESPEAAKPQAPAAPAAGAPKPAAPKPAPKPAAPKEPPDPAKVEAAKKAAAAKLAAAKAKAKAKAEDLPPPEEFTTRRTFLSWGMAAWVIFFGWLGGIGHLCLRFMFPRVLYEKDPKFRAGKRSDFPEVNKVYELFKEVQGVWLVRLVEDGEDRLVALSTVCTHLGCTPNWLEAEAKFKCPCHGSGFYKSGVNFEGPAPRPLERYRLYTDGAGDVLVDKSVKFREDLGQWGQPESFVKMA